MNMDESLLFGNDHDAPTSAEAQKRIAEMTQDFENTITKTMQPMQPMQPMHPTPASAPVNVTLPLNIPINSAQGIQYGGPHPSVIGQIATQPTLIQKPVGSISQVPVASLKQPPPLVSSTIPESTKLQELFANFRAGKMTKEVFNNNVIALFGKERGTDILIQMEKKIAANSIASAHQIKMGQIPGQIPPPTSYRVTVPTAGGVAGVGGVGTVGTVGAVPGTVGTVPTQGAPIQPVANSVLQQHLLQQKLGAGAPGVTGVTGVHVGGVVGVAGVGTGIAPVNVQVPTTISRAVVTGSIPTTPIAKPAAAAPHTSSKKKDEEMGDDEKPSIKDLNDVTKIAGVDLRAEEEGSLSDVPEDPSQATATKEAEPMLLNDTPLKRKVLQLTTQKGMKVHETIFPYLSAAVADQLRTVIEGLIRAADHRLEAHKDDYPTVVTSDPRKILAAIEKRDREEKARKEAEEKERLLKEAKQQEAALKKKQDDKNSVALREKLSKARAEEEDRLRTISANETALSALGDIGKKKAPSSLSTSSGAAPPPQPVPAPVVATPAPSPAPTTLGTPQGLVTNPAAKPPLPTITPVTAATPAPTPAAAAKPAAPTPTAVIIPPQGFPLSLPNGQVFTFTQTHLATLKQLVTMQRSGRTLTPPQTQAMNQLLSHYQLIQRIQASQAQATAAALDAKGKQQRTR